jgi:hypothetical protein
VKTLVIDSWTDSIALSDDGEVFFEGTELTFAGVSAACRRADVPVPELAHFFRENGLSWRMNQYGIGVVHNIHPHSRAKCPDKR